MPEEAFAGWKPGEGSTGVVGLSSVDKGEAAWPEEDDEGERDPCLDPWPVGPRTGMRMSPRILRVLCSAGRFSCLV